MGRFSLTLECIQEEAIRLSLALLCITNDHAYTEGKFLVAVLSQSVRAVLHFV